MTETRLAALLGHARILRHFLSRTDRQVDAEDESGRTALNWACYMSHEQVVRLRLDHYASMRLASKKAPLSTLLL